jgi:hypothetical protein
MLSPHGCAAPLGKPKHTLHTSISANFNGQWSMVNGQRLV